MKTSNRYRWVRVVFLVIGCCVLTGYSTRFVLYFSLRPDYGYSLDLTRYRPSFEAFLQSRELADGEQINGANLPDRMKDLEIINVYRNGRFVYFHLHTNCFIGDCVTSEFIWQLDDLGPDIEEILLTTKRKTFTIHRYSSAKRWYYWKHD